MSTSESSTATGGGAVTGVQGSSHATERAVYLVNTDRHGHVDPRGEDLKGREILSRAGLSAEKYELWTVVGGKTGEEIAADQSWRVEPGDHFRATIRGTDYSFPPRRVS